MSTVHKLIQTYQIDGVTVDNGTLTITDDEGDKFTDVVGHGVTNHEIFVDFTLARLKSLWIKSDVAVDLFTNATDGTGGDHIPLAAGVPFTWNIGMVNTPVPLAHDVTTFYSDNAGSADANIVIIRCLHNV
jgi:hypothetical protein